MKLSFWKFLRGQFAKQPPVLKEDLTGKTVVVVGANTGLGFEATKHFASMNPERLILACRSRSRGQAAVDKIKAETGYANPELWILDLSDFESVKQFGDKFERDGGRLDYLLLNAGINNLKYEATKDGWEASMQVNDLSTSLVALLLLPAMIETAHKYNTKPRIVVVSSEGHYWATIPKKFYETPDILKTLGSKEHCTSSVMRSHYFVTKLLNIFFVRALTARLGPDSPVTVNAANPGMCHSELGRDMPALIVFIGNIMKSLLAFTTEEGSRQFVWAALAHADAPQKMKGAYVSGTDLMEVSDFVLEHPEVEDRIWNELIDVLGAVDSRVHTTVQKYLSVPPAA